MIIFLDIDGVIATDKSYSEYEDRLDRKCIKVLNYLTTKIKAQIVISSTWRFEGLIHLKDLLKNAGVEADVLSVTPDANEKTQSGLLIAEGRGSEILKWIEENNYVGEYVVLDDEVSDIVKFIDSSRIIHCKNGFRKNGLTLYLVEDWLNDHKEFIR